MQCTHIGGMIENSLFNRDVVSETTEFALKTDACVIVRTVVDGIEGAATLRVGIMVIVLASMSDTYFQDGNEYTHAEVASPVVEPASGGIHQSRGIQLPYPLCQLKLWMVAGDLAPALVVHNL